MLVWDLASGRLLHTITAPDVVMAVAITPDGRSIVSGLGDHTGRVWDLASGRLLRTLSGHADMVSAVAVSPDGRSIRQRLVGQHREGLEGRTLAAQRPS